MRMKRSGIRMARRSLAEIPVLFLALYGDRLQYFSDDKPHHTCYNFLIEFLCEAEEYMKRKTLQELTIKDNFMFGALMCD